MESLHQGASHPQSNDDQSEYEQTSHGSDCIAGLVQFKPSHHAHAHGHRGRVVSETQLKVETIRRPWSASAPDVTTKSSLHYLPISTGCLLDQHTNVCHALAVPPCLPPAELLRQTSVMMLCAFEHHESRIRELIQLFVRERDPEKLKVWAAELQQLLTLESALRKLGRK